MDTEISDGVWIVFKSSWAMSTDLETFGTIWGEHEQNIWQILWPVNESHQTYWITRDKKVDCGCWETLVRAADFCEQIAVCCNKLYSRKPSFLPRQGNTYEYVGASYFYLLYIYYIIHCVLTSNVSLRKGHDFNKGDLFGIQNMKIKRSMENKTHSEIVILLIIITKLITPS